ncbi:cache domain-containing protein [Thermodesulfobacteriota bacterium]
MIVICEECGKNYRIDGGKIKGAETQFKCKDCGHQITVRKPVAQSDGIDPGPPVAVTSREENASEPDQSDATPSPKQVKRETQKKEKDKFDFSRPSKTRFGLTAKMFTMMIIISLVPLSMFWGVTLKQTKDRIRYEARKSSYQHFSRMVRDLDIWFFEKATIIKSLATFEHMTLMDKSGQKSILETVKNIHPDIHSVFTIDSNGMLFAGNSQGLPSEHTNLNYFKAIKGGKPFAWQTIMPEGSKKPGLIFASAIMKNNTLVGVLGSLITIDTISGRILFTETPETDFALLIKSNKRIIVHPVDKNIHQNTNRQWQSLAVRFKSGKGGLLPLENSAGQPPLLTFVDSTAFGWGLAVQTEEKESLFMLDQLMSFAYLLLAITVAFVFIIAWFSGRALSRPIIRLTNAADRISVGELDMEIRTNRKDEIGALAEAIARMQDSIRLSIERLKSRR